MGTCKRNSIDVMLDLETTGVSAGCGILSIGAITFDENESFYAIIDHSTCLQAGLKDNPETMNWWGKQSEEARSEAFSGTIPLVKALWDFHDWWHALQRSYGKAYIWGNGADFDQPILQGAYEAWNMDKPWGWDASRCYRTFKNLPGNKLIKADPFVGVAHNAYADAQHQARHAMKILRVNKEKDSIYAEILAEREG